MELDTIINYVRIIEPLMHATWLNLHHEKTSYSPLLYLFSEI